MKNSYLVVGVVIIVVILAFVFGKNKIEAPGGEKVTDKTAEVASFALADGSYKIDTSASVLKWKGEFVTGNSEEGTVGFRSGNAKITGGLVSSGEFTVDMSTIKDQGAKEILEDHLKSEDFFDVPKYPESVFEIKSVIPSSAEGAKVGRYVVAGNLTVKGITKAISFPASITMLTDGSIKAESSFAINRADWEIKYNSQTFFSDLGDKVIRDAVEIGLDIRAVKE